MRPYRFNLGIKGWLFVICFLLLLIMSVVSMAAEIRETKEDSIWHGKRVSQNDPAMGQLKRFQYSIAPMTTLMFAYPEISTESDDFNYAVFGGANKEGITSIKIVDIKKQQLLSEYWTDFSPLMASYDGKKSIIVWGEGKQNSSILELFQFVENGPKHVGGIGFKPGIIKIAFGDPRRGLLNVSLTWPNDLQQIIQMPYLDDRNGKSRFPTGRTWVTVSNSKDR